MRLIDADALRDKLQKEIDKAIPPFDDVMGSIRCGVRLARNIVEDEPTIHAAPERTGVWSEEYDPNDDPLFRRKYRCSACDDWNTYGFTRYCPNCGAWMTNSTAVMMAKQKETDNAETD